MMAHVDPKLLKSARDALDRALEDARRSERGECEPPSADRARFIYLQYRLAYFGDSV